MWDETDTMFAAFSALLVGCLIAICISAYIKDKEHEDFLRSHGCQLIKEAPTGRTISHGKTWTYENVYVYECLDGTKTEVR